MKLIVYKEKYIGQLLNDLSLNYSLVIEENELLACLEKEDIVFIKEDMNLVETIIKKENINIIFISKDDQKCQKAFQNHVSSYLVEPIQGKDLYEELKYIRYGEWNKPFIRCYGQFELFVQKKSIPFPRKKAKEILAYLVYKKGELVSVEELQKNIFVETNEKNRRYVYVLKYDCYKVLKAHGIERILETVGNRFRVNTEAFSCDYYEYLQGKTSLYQGEFMKQFSWAQDFME